MHQIKIFCVAGVALGMISAFIIGGVWAVETVDRIVAVVNEDIIRLKELDTAFQPIAQQIFNENYAPEKEQEILYERRIEVLNQLIDEALVDQVIKKKGVSVSPAEIDRAVEQVKSMNYYTDETLRRSLRMSGMDMESYRDQIRRQILRSKLVNREVKSSIVITEGEIREYYASHPEKYKGQSKYHLKNIFVARGEDTSGASLPKAREKIEAARAGLNNGESFESMAKKYSEAGNATAGGELGTFLMDDLRADLQPVIARLAPGQTSSIIETEQGFQIFYLKEMSQSPDKNFDEVAADIRMILYDQAVDEKFQEWLESLRNEAHVKIVR